MFSKRLFVSAAVGVSLLAVGIAGTTQALAEPQSNPHIPCAGTLVNEKSLNTDDGGEVATIQVYWNAKKANEKYNSYCAQVRIPEAIKASNVSIEMLASNGVASTRVTGETVAHVGTKGYTFVGPTHMLTDDRSVTATASLDCGGRSYRFSGDSVSDKKPVKKSDPDIMKASAITKAGDNTSKSSSSGSNSGSNSGSGTTNGTASAAAPCKGTIIDTTPIVIDGKSVGRLQIFKDQVPNYSRYCVQTSTGEDDKLGVINVKITAFNDYASNGVFRTASKSVVVTKNGQDTRYVGPAYIASNVSQVQASATVNYDGDKYSFTGKKVD